MTSRRTVAKGVEDVISDGLFAGDALRLELAREGSSSFCLADSNACRKRSESADGSNRGSSECVHSKA